MLDVILKHRRWIDGIALAISIWAWSVELAGWAYVCPFCRAQRTVIGLLGIALLFPIYGHWLTRYAAATIGFFGANVAATQHFGGWRRLSSGEYEMHSPFYYDSFLLSGAALFILSALVMLLWIPHAAPQSTTSPIATIPS